MAKKTKGKQINQGQKSTAKAISQKRASEKQLKESVDNLYKAKEKQVN